MRELSEEAAAEVVAATSLATLPAAKPSAAHVAPAAAMTSAVASSASGGISSLRSQALHVNFRPVDTSAPLQLSAQGWRRAGQSARHVTRKVGLL